ncbi:MAG: hypothetical protein ACJAZW_001575 [Maritalea sp.]
MKYKRRRYPISRLKTWFRTKSVTAHGLDLYLLAFLAFPAPEPGSIVGSDTNRGVKNALVLPKAG